MRINLFLALILVLIFGCGRRDSCSEVENKSYQYPILPTNHTMTNDQVDRYVDIPKQIAECISTDSLIKSVLTYPYISLIFAGVEQQSGYDLVKKQFRGLPELEKRSDCGDCLLKLYKSHDPLGFDKTWGNVKIGRYMEMEAYIEIIQAQYIKPPLT